MGSGASIVAPLTLENIVIEIGEADSSVGSTTATETESDTLRGTQVDGVYGQMLHLLTQDQRRMIDALDLNCNVYVRTLGWL